MLLRLSVGLDVLAVGKDGEAPGQTQLSALQVAAAKAKGSECMTLIVLIRNAQSLPQRAHAAQRHTRSGLRPILQSNRPTAHDNRGNRRSYGGR